MVRFARQLEFWKNRAAASYNFKLYLMMETKDIKPLPLLPVGKKPDGETYTLTEVLQWADVFKMPCGTVAEFNEVVNLLRLRGRVFNLSEAIGRTITADELRAMAEQIVEAEKAIKAAKAKEYRENEYEARRTNRKLLNASKLPYTERANKLDQADAQILLPDKADKQQQPLVWEQITQQVDVPTRTAEQIRTAILKMPHCKQCKRVDSEKSAFIEYHFKPQDLEKIIDWEHPNRVNGGEVRRLLECLNETRFLVDVKFKDGTKKIPLPFIQFGAADTGGKELYLHIHKALYNQEAMLKRGAMVEQLTQYAALLPTRIIQDDRARKLAYQIQKRQQKKYRFAELLKIADIPDSNTTTAKRALCTRLELLKTENIIVSYEAMQDADGLYYIIDNGRKNKEKDTEKAKKKRTKKAKK